MDKRIKGLIECPVWDKVFLQSEWASHRWHEQPRRRGTSKPIFKNADGRYTCVVPYCQWMGSTHCKLFKEHLLKHTYEEISTGPYPPGVTCDSIMVVDVF